MCKYVHIFVHQIANTMKHISTKLAKATAISDMLKEGKKVYAELLNANKVTIAPIRPDLFLSLSQPGKLINF